MTSTLVLALGILTSSFFGSWHCAAMCSPIACLMGERKSLLSYHLGRLLAYLTLGILGGYLGQFFLNSNFIWLRIASAVFFAILLLLMGVNLLAPRWSQKYLPKIEHHAFFNIFKHVRKFHLNQSGFAVGLLTALLPCGWLYTYVTAAIATQNPSTGALLMFLFWLGGLPALSVIPAMVRKPLHAVSRRHQRIAGCILVGASIYSVASFMMLH